MAGKGGSDQVQRFIRILINMAGVEESQEQSEKFYKTHHDGMDQAKRDAETASPKIEEFLNRWKYELMLVGGAIAGIYAIVKYSSVAHTMTDLLGRSFGFLADVILVNLLPVVVVLAGWILEVGKVFRDLPDGIQDVIAYALLGAAALWGLYKALVSVGIAGGVAGTILGGLAGLVIGIEIVLLIREMGFFKVLGDIIGEGKAMFLNWLDGLQMSWDNFWIDRMNVLINLYQQTLGRIPGMPQLEEIRHMDEYDYYLQDLLKEYEAFGGGAAGGRTATGSTPEAHPEGSTWADIIDQMEGLGMTPEEYVEFMRKNNIPTPTWEFVPPHAGWNEEENPIKDFLAWGYDYKDEWRTNKSLFGTGSGAGELPASDTRALQDYYASMFPGASGSQGGAGGGQQIIVQINQAEIHLDPTDSMNRSFLDQIVSQTNRSNSLSMKGKSTYG